MPDTPLNPDGVLNAMDTLMAETDADERATEWARKVTTRVLEGYFAAALPEVTSIEELDQLPHGAIIMATGGNWNPEHPELFLKCGYAHAPWMALDPSDRDDGENLESSGAILKWRCDGSARVLYRPEVKP